MKLSGVAEPFDKLRTGKGKDIQCIWEITEEIEK